MGTSFPNGGSIVMFGKRMIFDKIGWICFYSGVVNHRDVALQWIERFLKELFWMEHWDVHFIGAPLEIQCFQLSRSRSQQLDPGWSPGLRRFWWTALVPWRCFAHDGILILGWFHGSSWTIIPTFFFSSAAEVKHYWLVVWLPSILLSHILGC